MRLGASPFVFASLTTVLACTASVSNSTDSGGADASVSTRDGGPVDAGSGPGPDASYVTSLTKDGITWTFSGPVLAGQFITGDDYVVGPVTVVAISPAPDDGGFFANGSVVDLPTADGKSPFDQRLNDGTPETFWFNAADRAYPPLTLHPGDALVSSISLPACLADGGCANGGTCGNAAVCHVPEVMREGDLSSSPVASVSVLTVLSAPAPADAFRPSYCDRQQTLRLGRNLDRGLLPSLSPPPGAPAPPPLSTFEAYFRRPWLDMDPFLFDAPAEYMPSYGMHVALADSYAALLLELNFPADQKTNLTNYFVQYGIDLYGCVQAGYGWPAFGGHRSGRKLPILFAGMLLGDAALLSVDTAYPNHFGEDMQTAYQHDIQLPGSFTVAWNGATVVYTGHYGVLDGGIPVSAGLYGPYEQLPPAQWPLLTPTEQLGESYRRCCTSISWVGEALAMRLFDGGTQTWAHPAFFDYVDRWMNEPGTQTVPDSQCVADILADAGFDYTANWEAQGQTQYWLQGEFPQNTFVDDMWNAYR